MASLGLAACDPFPENAGVVSSTSSGTGATTTSEGSTGSTSRGPVAETTEGDGVTTTGSTTNALDDGTSGTSGIPLDVNEDPECVDWASFGCGIPGARGTVTGTTPLGDFDTPLAVFGSAGGCFGTCVLSPNIRAIYMAADLAVIEELDTAGWTDETLALEIEFGNDGFEGPTGQPVGGTLYASRDGVTEQTNAVEVVIDNLPTMDELDDEFDPFAAAVVTGTFAAEGDGWSVAGAFAASYCPEVNVIPICE
jgi:hypothetical protein